jgi:protein-tyrosine-phosphatase
MSAQPALRSVLFVCTANQCRSPMAEALLKSLAAQRGEADRWLVQSAGTWAEHDHPATALTQVVMQRRNIDLSDHRSRPVDAELLAAATVVMVMTHHHLEALQAEFPQVRGKVFLVSQLIGRSFDIEDPYSGGLDDYELCATELQDILTDGYDRLAGMIDQSSLVQH